MLARIHSGATFGLSSILVEVEVDIPSQGFPGFVIVGLPGKAVKESCERVRSAIKNSGFEFPNKKIIVNLTPANLPKEGAIYDLPIALGILMADGQIKKEINSSLFFGELSLDGTLRHSKGALPLSILARDEKLKNIFLPSGNSKEASIISNINIFPIQNLKQLVDFLNGHATLKTSTHQKVQPPAENTFPFDMADIKGQEQAKRAMEIAAAGGHNVFMIGPPGSGKTMLARTIPSILPEMTETEILELTKIYSVSGKLSEENSLVLHRPFRSPHHTTSIIGLIGGSSQLVPGEISLAHRGVLFLDEFLEFPRSILESLRQPLEDGLVTVSRALGTVQFPAQFILVAAANPCPCGYLGSKKRHCTCLSSAVARYRQRLSGPILDRIDLHISVPEVELDKLSAEYKSESSVSVRKRVNLARKKQIERFVNLNISLFSNSDMNTKQVKQICQLDKESQVFLNQAAEKMNLSARSYFRVTKVARTIADLANKENIEINHLAEALQYRYKSEEN